MTGFKKFLYVVYTLLFLATIAMVIYNDSLIATFTAETMYTFWMFWSLVGFGLLMLESVFENIHLWSVKRNQTQLERENTELKAKLYDHIDGRDTGKTVVKEREVWHKGQNDVASARDEGDRIRIRERDGDERVIYKGRPGSTT